MESSQRQEKPRRPGLSEAVGFAGAVPPWLGSEREKRPAPLACLAAIGALQVSQFTCESTLARFRRRVGPAAGHGSVVADAAGHAVWARAWKPSAGLVELTLRQGSDPEGPGAPAVRTIATRVHRVVPSRRVKALIRSVARRRAL